MKRADNLWLGLRDGDHWVLPQDEQAVAAFNARCPHENYKLAVDLPPAPYVGHINAPRVVLLMSNPGLIDEDYDDHKRDDLRAACLDNILQADQTYPFFPLDPRFAETAVGKYWQPRLRYLMPSSPSQAERKKLASHLCVLQWHGYHSRLFRADAALRYPGLASQQFVFSHLQKLLCEQPGCLVISMRSSRLWQEKVPNFDRVRIRHNRASHVSPGNLQDLFKDVCSALDY